MVPKLFHETKSSNRQQFLPPLFATPFLGLSGCGVLGAVLSGPDVVFHLLKGSHFLSFHPQGSWARACLPRPPPSAAITLLGGSDPAWA